MEILQVQIEYENGEACVSPFYHDKIKTLIDVKELIQSFETYKVKKIVIYYKMSPMGKVKRYQE